VETRITNICDHRISIKLKGKFYRITMKPTKLYGTKFWALKMDYVRKMLNQNGNV
jgi:hypothetical protein